MNTVPVYLPPEIPLIDLHRLAVQHGCRIQWDRDGQALVVRPVQPQPRPTTDQETER